MASDTVGFVTVAEACRRIGISKSYGSKLTHEGLFPVPLVKVGTRPMVRVKDLHRFIDGPDGSAVGPGTPPPAVGTDRRADRSEPVPAVPVLAEPSPVSSIHKDEDARLQPDASVDAPRRLNRGSRRAS